MISLLKRIFTENWPRKLVAIIISIAIWYVVHHTLTGTKVFPKVAIRVVNIPPGMTIKELGADGFLSKTINLTITGSKQYLDFLTPSQIEVVLNAESKPQDWKVRIGKRDISLIGAPDSNLRREISSITHPPLELHFVPVKTAKIPVIVTRPTGHPPRGWQYTGIFPKQFLITVKGSDTQIKELKTQGLHLTFDLNMISTRDLEMLHSSTEDHRLRGLGFKVPRNWKKIPLPFAPFNEVEIDDPHAEALKIYFLREELLPLDKKIPINLIYPTKISNVYNLDRIKMQTAKYISQKGSESFLDIPLFAMNVSELFLDIARDNLVLNITVDANDNQELVCSWALDFVNLKKMEQDYIEAALADSVKRSPSSPLEKELKIQKFQIKFYNYVRHIQLYTAPQQLFDMDLELHDEEIVITSMSQM